MGIEHYIFAIFVSGLICLIAILAKILFADVRRQHKLLDEKEEKLLQLYKTIEGIMEEFNDQVEASTNELKEYEIRISKRGAANPSRLPEPIKTMQPLEKPVRPLTADQSRIKAASEVIGRAEKVIKGNIPSPPSASESGNMFQRLFDETATETHAAELDTNAKIKRKELILALAAEGKSNTQIAKELGITQNEVKFVLELGNGKL